MAVFWLLVCGRSKKFSLNSRKSEVQIADLLKNLQQASTEVVNAVEEGKIQVRSALETVSKD